MLVEEEVDLVFFGRNFVKRRPMLLDVGLITVRKGSPWRGDFAFRDRSPLDIAQAFSLKRTIVE